MAGGRGRPAPKLDEATRAFRAGHAMVGAHPLFAPLLRHARIVRRKESPLPRPGWVLVSSDHVILCDPKRRGDPDEWAYVLAHALLHLGFGHFSGLAQGPLWILACDLVVHRFLADLKFARPPAEISLPEAPPGGSERDLFDWLRGLPPDGLARWSACGTITGADMEQAARPAPTWLGQPVDWPGLLAQGLRQAVASAVLVAGGATARLDSEVHVEGPGARARAWFIDHYPLLGAAAAAFRVIEDIEVCRRAHISVAAVDIAASEIFINPAAGLNDLEWRFVMAHEILHAGLRHDARRHGRDPFLWNVACDYVINGWLLAMNVGDLPAIGALYDPALDGLSAETVYDRLATDLRRVRKLATLRGAGACDILDPAAFGRWGAVPSDLDDFYRRCLIEGLDYHRAAGRGLLPAGLVEEIRALAFPPIPWDVDLARWFDEQFPAIDKTRSYARPSRRQAATPDIPRPRWVPAPGADEGRTFGVVLDTSGSMDRTLLGRAIGAIASYAVARDVRRVRLIFCDAAAHDQGYVPVEALADRVRVVGRGGTVLRPGIDLLLEAKDFPAKGPILVITDGMIDRLVIPRTHAFLIPRGARLPFPPKGPVFRVG